MIGASILGLLILAVTVVGLAACFADIPDEVDLDEPDWDI